MIESIIGRLKYRICEPRFYLRETLNICLVHYLASYVNKEKLLFCFEKYIYSNPKRENNIDEIIAKLKGIFKNKRYMARLQSSNKNWEEIELPIVINELINFWDSLH